MVKHNELIEVDENFFETKTWKICADIDGVYQWKVERLICEFMRKYRKEIDAAEDGTNPAEWEAAERQVWKIFWVNPTIALRIVEESSLYKVVDVHAAMKTVYYVLSEKFGYMKNRILNKRDKFILLIVESCFSNAVREDSRIDVGQYLGIAYRRKYKNTRLLTRYTLHHIYTHIPDQRKIFLITWLWDKYRYEKSLVRRDKNNQIIPTENRPLQYLEYVLEEARTDDLWEVCEYKGEYARFVHSVMEDGEHPDFLNIVLGQDDLENKIADLQKLYSRLNEREFEELQLSDSDEMITAIEDMDVKQMYTLMFREREIKSAVKRKALEEWLDSTKIWHEWIRKKEIICPETKMLVAYYVYLHEDKEQRKKLLPNILRHPVDILRYATKITDPEHPNLYFQGKLRFKLGNQERREVIRLLNKCEDLYEGVWENPNQFKLLMQMIHVRPEQAPRVAQVFNNLYNKRKVDENGNPIRSAHSIYQDIQKECAEGNIEVVKEFARQHPQIFFQNMFRLIELATDYGRELELVDLIRELGTTMKPGNTLKLARNAHLRNQKSWRISYSKRMNKYMEYTSNAKKIDEDVLARIDEHCMYASVVYFQGRDYVGKVYIAPELFHILFPRRITNKTFHGQTYTFGSDLVLENAELIRRISIKWKGASDVDLHMEFYNEQMEHIGSCGYENQEGILEDIVVSRHSGDMAPFMEEDAVNTEFIDIDLLSMQKLGIGYFTVTVNVMNEDSLWTVRDIMLEISEFSGRLGDEKMPADAALVLCADMKSDAQQCVVFICDVEAQRLVWVERAMERDASAVSQTRLEIYDALYCPNASMGQIFTAYGKANGQLTENMQEADLIFTVREPLSRDNLKEGAQVVCIDNWSYILEKFVE